MDRLYDNNHTDAVDNESKNDSNIFSGEHVIKLMKCQLSSEDQQSQRSLSIAMESVHQSLSKCSIANYHDPIPPITNPNEVS